MADKLATLSQLKNALARVRGKLDQIALTPGPAGAKGDKGDPGAPCNRNYLRQIDNPNVKRVNVNDVEWAYDRDTQTYTLTTKAVTYKTFFQIYWFDAASDIDFLKGKQVTLSIEDYACTSPMSSRIAFALSKAKNEIVQPSAQITPEVYFPLATGQRSVTFNIPENTDAVAAYCLLRVDQNQSAPAGTVMTIKGLKLEIGGEKTPFILNMEDLMGNANVTYGTTDPGAGGPLKEGQVYLVYE